MITTLDISNNNYNNECLICLDYIEDGSLLILNELDTIIRDCNCKGTFHRECFYTWYHNNSTCPICTLEIIVNDIDENEKCCCICLDYDYWLRQKDRCIFINYNTLVKLIKCIKHITFIWCNCLLCIILIKFFIWVVYVNKGHNV